MQLELVYISVKINFRHKKFPFISVWKNTRSRLLCENTFCFHFLKYVVSNLLIRSETLEMNHCDGEKMKC